LEKKQCYVKDNKKKKRKKRRRKKINKRRIRGYTGMRERDEAEK